MAAGSNYAPSAISGASSARRSPRLKVGESGEGGDGRDDLDPRRGSSVENAVFGVLFTLSKEINENRIVIRWALLKMLIDGWQLFTTIIQPEVQGWDINEDGPAWKVVSVLSFNWLADIGYGAYVALLYAAVALLAVNIGLCVWVAWCFSQQKFPVVWPIKVLRLFSSVFFQAFDIASLNLLQLGISCRYTGPVTPHLHMALFPDKHCGSMPQIIHAVVSGVSLLIFILLALLTNMAEVEPNPKSRRPMALGHSGAEVATFVIKVLMTLVDVFLGWRKVAACAYLALSLLLAWQYLRWSPNMVGWVNHVKVAVSTSILWCAAMGVLLVFQPGVKSGGLAAWRHGMTVAMLAGIGPTMGLGAWASWFKERRTNAAALCAIKEATAAGTPLQDLVVDLVTSPRDVEMLARCCRVWVDRHSLDKDAIARSQMVIKAGLSMFPGNAFVSLVQANHMIDVLGVGQSGRRQVEVAGKQDPGIMSRFIIFVRKQQAQQKAAGSTIGDSGGANMDLLGYVEYQRKQHMVLRLHREALQAMANFWKMLDSHTVSFTALSKTLVKIDASVSQAQSAYRVVLETYGKNPRLVRLYGKFLETVKNDPWGAAEYFAEADRLEQAKNDDSKGPLLPDGTPLSRMDDLPTAVLMMTSSGEIQMANKQAHSLFGYKKGDLDGKAVAALLVPQSTRHISALLSALVERSLAALGSKEEEADAAGGATERTVVLGMHRERMAFPLRVTLSKASGMGEDSTFVAVMQPVPPGRNAARLWVTPNGVIAACDPAFIANFGFQSSDVVGAQLGAYLQCETGSHGGARASEADLVLGPTVDVAWDSEAAWGAGDAALMSTGGEAATMLDRLLAMTASADIGKVGAGAAADGSTSCSCLMTHRYSAPIAACATVRAINLGDSPLYEVTARFTSAEPLLMLVADNKGAIKFASPSLATLLCPRSAHGVPVASTAGAEGAGADGPQGAQLGSSHLITTCTLQDFLASPWKDMHSKFLKSAAGAPSRMRSQWSCRRPGTQGPTLELRNIRGQPLHMHVSVHGTEGGAGEALHVVRLAKSSPEAAVAERRLRLVVSLEGKVSAVVGLEAHEEPLFGFDPNQVVGSPLVEVVEGLQQQLLGDSQRDSSARPLAATSGRRSRVGQQSDGVSFHNLLQRVLAAPEGSSWRVTVVPPLAAAKSSNALAMRTELLEAQRAARTLPAVAQLQLVTDAASSQLLVDLYPLQALSGVLELDAMGRVASVLEERTRPVGLLFGVEVAALMNQQLRSWVALPAGCSSFADLLSAGGAKKSSLKHTKKDLPVKVGHVHVLTATHADGKPLQLDVQVVGKPGTSSVTVLLRPHVNPMLPGMQLAAATIPPAIPPAAVSTGVRMSSTLPAADGDAGGDPPKAADKPLLLALMQGGSRTGTPAGGAPGTPKRISRVPSTPDTPPASGPALLSLPTHGSGGSGSGTGPQLPPPPVPEALGLGLDLPLPGVVTSSRRAEEKAAGAAADAGGAKEATAAGAGDGAVRPKSAAVLKMEASMRNNSLDRQLTEMGLGAAVDADSEDGAAQEQDQQEPPAQPNAKTMAGAAAVGGVISAKASGAESAAESGDESDDAAAGRSDAGTDDGAKAVAPKNMDRISTWVVSKGEVFQNQAPAGAWGTAGSNVEGLADVDGDEGVMQLMAGGERKGFMPAAGKAAAAVGGGSGKWVAAEPRKGAGGAMVVPAPMEAREDDAMSDGGQSAMSGVSAASTGAEYKRGKRFRNLVKLMDSSAAEQILRRFRYGALLTGAVLAVSHIVCFVLVVTSIKNQQHAMTQLVVAGRAQLYLSRVLVAVRALDLVYKGRAPTNLYTRDDVAGFGDDVFQYAKQVKELNNLVMSENRNSPVIEDLYYFTNVRAWSDINKTSGEDVFENITIWDLATKVYMSAKDIHQNLYAWDVAGVNISDTPAGKFLLTSGETFFSGHRQVMDSLLSIAMEYTQEVNTLQMAFLVAEGCGVSLLAAALLIYLLRRLAVQRYTLYGTFLAIPVGLTRALTSQITNSLLLEDDEDEEADDDEAQKAALSGDPKQKRRATVDMPAGAGEAATGDTGGKDAADSLSPAGKGGVLLRRQTTTMENGASRGWLANCLSCVCFRNPKVMPRTISGVDALGDGGAGADAAAKASKRTLKRDSHDTLLLLTPFMLWSTLVFIFYAVSVAQLKGVDPLVALASVSNYNIARTYRTCFYAQELAAEENPAMLQSRRDGLYRMAIAEREAYYTLQLGQDAYKALGPSTERFPGVTVGLSYETDEMSDLFYSNEECLRAEANFPCPGPEWRFYEATHAGLDSIQQVYLSHAFALANDLSNNTVGLDNPRFDFMYNVGTKDLTDANIKVGLLHFDFIEGTFSDIMMLHVLLFVMLWVCLAGFLFLLLNPLVKRYKKEKRRIAELMSQLPLELDVEKLVGRALGAAGNTSDALMQNGATAAVAEQGHSDAAKAWKNVLRSAASTAGARGAKGELAARENSLRPDGGARR